LAAYIATNIISHNGRTFKKGEEVTGLNEQEIKSLLEIKAIVQYGQKPGFAKDAGLREEFDKHVKESGEEMAKFREATQAKFNEMAAEIKKLSDDFKAVKK